MLSTAENTSQRVNRANKKRSLIISIISWLISGFYLLSTLGWLFALYTALRGQLGPQAMEFFQSLTLIDHIVRASQILIIISASISLIFYRKSALHLFSISLLIGLLSLLIRGKWVISFIGSPFAIFILIAICLYISLINRRHYLK